MIPPPQLKEIYQKIFAIQTNGVKIVTGDPVASMLLGSAVKDDCGNTAVGGCAAGISGLTILPDGTVSPCRRLSVAIGNIRQDSLREIWADSPVLNQLRDRASYQGKCATCRRWALCRGCRAIAYAASLAHGEGYLLSTDPQCFMAE